MSFSKIKIILIVLCLVIIVTVAGIFIKNRLFGQDPQKLIASIQRNVALSIGDVHQVSTRNGVKEWVLDAKSAHVVDESKQLMLEDVRVVYFLNDGREIHLTAGKGILKTETNDIDVTDHVVISYENYTLKTEHITYSHSQRVLTSPAPVRIAGTTMDLTADSMKYDLSTNQTQFGKNVEVLMRERSL